ncbi:MAG: TldD/PmbA family protein [Bacteroidales bacterium]|nr:TldD/PmbA family protein [Bacteroidales bacterium]
MEFFKVDIEMLQRLIAIAMSRGGDYADLFFEFSSLDEMQLRDRKVSSVGQHVDYGVGIRVLKGEQTGYAYSESTEWDKMEKAAATAAAIADGLVQAPRPVCVTEIRHPSYYPSEDSWKAFDSSRRIDFLQRLNDSVYALDGRITNVMEVLSSTYDRTLFFNSLGELAEDCGPLSSLGVSVVAKEGTRRETASFSRSFRMGSEFLSDSLMAEMASEVVQRCSMLFTAGSVKGGTMPVVMGAGGSGILLHEAIGHAFEADFIRKGTSIFTDSLGKKVCSEKISVVDDGTIPFNRGSINIDDEGVPSQKTYMVTNGVLTSFLHDRVSAKHYGVAPTGNGRRESFRYNPIPRMRATYMENGDATKDDIIASVKNGVFLDTFSNGQVQIGAGDFTFYVKSGWLIENGKLTRPLKDINVIGNGPQALADIVAVASDCVIDDGKWTCGKEQYVPVSCGMPTVLVSKLSVGGI